MNEYIFELLQQTLILSPLKAIFWKEQNALIVTDLHLGKAAHFRKSGIAISGMVHQVDFDRLNTAINTYNPKKILILGDLFHSELNNEWNKWANWCIKTKTTGIQLILVKGNHDILEPHYYEVFDEIKTQYDCPPFCFTHIAEPDSSLYNLSGHVHPGVKISGLGRQSLTLPCFYFGKRHGILPAFGKFTGIKKISFNLDDIVFAITEDSVVQLTQNSGKF